MKTLSITDRIYSELKEIAEDSGDKKATPLDAIAWMLAEHHTSPFSSPAKLRKNHRTATDLGQVDYDTFPKQEKGLRCFVVLAYALDKKTGLFGSFSIGIYEGKNAREALRQADIEAYDGEDRKLRWREKHASNGTAFRYFACGELNADVLDLDFVSSGLIE